MNSRMASPIRASHQPDSPSRYRTKMNPTYTSADPVSFSPRMISIGNTMTRAVRMKLFSWDIL